jgi:hypothetical protein
VVLTGIEHFGAPRGSKDDRQVSKMQTAIVRVVSGTISAISAAQFIGTMVG